MARHQGQLWVRPQQVDSGEANGRNRRNLVLRPVAANDRFPNRNGHSMLLPWSSGHAPTQPIPCATRKDRFGIRNGHPSVRELAKERDRSTPNLKRRIILARWAAHVQRVRVSPYDVPVVGGYRTLFADSLSNPKKRANVGSPRFPSLCEACRCLKTFG